jgi:hypothetical protein
MEYVDRDEVRFAFRGELAQITKELNSSPTLKDIVLGCQYAFDDLRENRISMFYSTRRSRRKKQKAYTVGYVDLKEDKFDLSLVGKVECYGRASNNFKNAVHNIAHKFNVPLDFPLNFNLSR